METNRKVMTGETDVLGGEPGRVPMLLQVSRALACGRTRASKERRTWHDELVSQAVCVYMRICDCMKCRPHPVPTETCSYHILTHLWRVSDIPFQS